jgi:hypothetical protein
MVYLLMHEKPQELCNNMKVLLELLQHVGVVYVNLFLYLVYYNSFDDAMILCVRIMVLKRRNYFLVIGLMLGNEQQN